MQSIALLIIKLQNTGFLFKKKRNQWQVTCLCSIHQGAVAISRPASMTTSVMLHMQLLALHDLVILFRVLFMQEDDYAGELMEL